MSFRIPVLCDDPWHPAEVLQRGWGALGEAVFSYRRVCVLTPGHNLEVWLHPGFQALLRHALNWCATLN